jgi:uncharacterized protein (TIGR03067 family)
MAWPKDGASGGPRGWAVALALAALGLAGLGRGDDSGPAAEARPGLIRRSPFGCWREVSCTEAGRTEDRPNQLTGWRLAPREVEVWDYSGDLSPTTLDYEVRFDPTKVPMRLDLVSEWKGERQKRVLPGIVRFDGERLVWVTPAQPEGWRPLNPSGDCPNRPTGFASTRQNGHVRRVLERCALYEQFRARKRP